MYRYQRETSRKDYILREWLFLTNEREYDFRELEIVLLSFSYICMKTYNEYKKLLLSKGYKEDGKPEEYDDNRYSGLFINNDYHSVVIESEGSSVKESTVVLAVIESPIISSPKSYYNEYDVQGITLSPDDENNNLSKFEECLSLKSGSRKLFDHTIMIQEKHLDNLRWIQENMYPILDRYDFSIEIEDSSEWDNGLNGIITSFTHHPSEKTITFVTDSLTGELLISGVDLDKSLKEYDMNELNLLFIREFLTDRSTIDISYEFKYLFSPDQPNLTKYTWIEELELARIIDNKGDLSKINKSILSKEYLQKYNEYEKEQLSRESNESY